MTRNQKNPRLSLAQDDATTTAATICPSCLGALLHRWGWTIPWLARCAGVAHSTAWRWTKRPSRITTRPFRALYELTGGIIADACHEPPDCPRSAPPPPTLPLT